MEEAEKENGAGAGGGGGRGGQGEGGQGGQGEQGGQREQGGQGGKPKGSKQAQVHMEKGKISMCRRERIERTDLSQRFPREFLTSVSWAVDQLTIDPEGEGAEPLEAGAGPGPSLAAVGPPPAPNPPPSHRWI